MAIRVIRFRSAGAGLAIALFVSILMADTLMVDLCPQGDAYEWCWAASTQSLCRYYDKNFNKTLTQVASVYTTNKNTCPPIDQLPTLLPQIVEKNGSAINMKTVFRSGKVSWAEYKKEIDEKRPFIFVIKWDVSGIYHCNVASGYLNDSSRLYYMDPGNNDKRWRTWKEITGEGTIKSGNTKKGTWLGSLMVLPQTSISNQTQTRMAPFTIITHSQAKNNGFVTMHFNSTTVSSTVLKFFNLRGSCVYQMTAATDRKDSYFQVPYQFSAGNYIVTCNQSIASGLAHETAASFSIQK
ncbi:MAG: C39 family peptidase [Chitinivibrionales bacterium]|nr:C39 family peptidase [Chitinivibrionales bacterium]